LLDYDRVVLFFEDGFSVDLELVPRAQGLGEQVVAIELVGRDHVRNAARDLDPIALQLRDLVRVVGHQRDRLDVQAGEHVRRDFVVPLVVAEPQRAVRLDGVEAPVLQRVGAHLVAQPDAPALLAQVEEQASVHRAEPPQGHLELVAAVAAQGAQRVAGEAFGVEARGHFRRAHHVAVHEPDVLFPVTVVPERHDLEAAESGRQLGDRVDLHADPVRAEAAAVVVLVPLDQVFQPSDAPQARARRCRGHSAILRIFPGAA
jgi:hypothetical protein